MTDSLQARLGIATVLVVILFILAAAAVLDSAFDASENRALRERMSAQLYVLLTTARLDASGRLIMPPPTDLPEPALAIGDSGLYAFVAANGQVIWRSPSTNGLNLPPPLAVLPGEHIWRHLTLADGQDYSLLGYGFAKSSAAGTHPFGFYLLAERAPLQREIAVYRERLWLGLVVVALLLVFTQIAVLRWSLGPLRRIATELSAIEAGTVQRIEGRYPAEIRQLTTNLNLLLHQERARQTRYRNALADLAHSLKTSLAVLRGAVDHPATLESNVIEQSHRMTQIVERQLQRAAMLGETTAVASVALCPLVERVAASLEKVYRDKPVTLENWIDADLRFRGDEADLFEVLGNLLDNAYKWSVNRIAVEGRWDARTGLTLMIHDDGPGFALGCLDRLIERGVRADETAPGHGIGLAVVADIAEGYRGRLRFGSSLLGGALVVVEFGG